MANIIERVRTMYAALNLSIISVLSSIKREIPAWKEFIRIFLWPDEMSACIVFVAPHHFRPFPDPKNCGSQTRPDSC